MKEVKEKMILILYYHIIKEFEQDKHINRKKLKN